MKKLLLSTLLILSINYLFAQGNLQFNRVISTTATGSILAPPNDEGTLLGSITVPTGKVLKLESISVYNIGGDGDLETIKVAEGGSSESNSGCWIGNHLVWTPLIDYLYGNFRASLTSNFPIWLDSGTHEIRIRTNSNIHFYGGYAVVSYSAIEFNII